LGLAARSGVPGPVKPPPPRLSHTLNSAGESPTAGFAPGRSYPSTGPTSLRDRRGIAVAAELERCLPMLGGPPDGSYRSVLINPKIRGRRREAPLAAARAGQPLDPSQAMWVRVVEYMIEDRATCGELFCLITNLLDHETAPAVELAGVYHERWDIELSFDEIETHHIGHQRVLRSRAPELVKQEIWGMLLTHYAIRHIMKDAADTVGTDPDRLSFMRSFRVIRRQVANQAGFSPSPNDDGTD